MEYLEEFGFEMLQPDELMRWWAPLSLYPRESCEIVVSLLSRLPLMLLTAERISCSTGLFVGFPLSEPMLWVTRSEAQHSALTCRSEVLPEHDDCVLQTVWQHADSFLMTVPFLRILVLST